MLARYFLPVAALATTPTLAQLGTGVPPTGWQPGVPVEEGFPEVVVPLVQTSEDTSPGEFRWGWPVATSIDLGTHSLWATAPDGSQRGRVVIRSPHAVGLALQFDQWELPEGAVVHLYDMGRRKVIGGFTSANRAPDGTMATEQLPGEAVMIECLLPAGTGMALRVSGITHGIMDLTGKTTAAERDFWPGFPADPCHINVACPQGAAWQQQKRGAVMFIRPDGGGCTGALVNNTAIPGRPLLHIANHCYQPTTSQWVFYFNYEAPLCVGDTGSTTQTMTGCTNLAGDYFKDFNIIELLAQPPAAFAPYYLGWDRTGDVPQNTAVLHHPHYDVKKITFDHDPSTTWVDEEGYVMWRQYWDEGLVQSGSSGAPLLDHNKRLVGHMAVGAQDCETAGTIPTGCVKFTEGWDGPNASSRKRDWLDPSDLVFQLDGYDPFPPAGIAVRPRAYLDGPYNVVTDMMDDGLRTGGHLPLTEPYTALGYVHVGGGGETVAPSVLAVVGSNAVVDWVVVELRHPSNATTILATRSALLQRDGDVVATDGIGPVTFPLASGNYRVAVRHRNHLGIMSANGIALSATPVSVDLSNGSVPLYGGANAAKPVDGRLALYAGDGMRDDVLRYVGLNNDRDPILTTIGGTIPTGSASGYLQYDLNCDGQVLYTGTNNDRDIILMNVGGGVPTNVRNGSLP